MVECVVPRGHRVEPGALGSRTAQEVEEKVRFPASRMFPQACPWLAVKMALEAEG